MKIIRILIVNLIIIALGVGAITVIDRALQSKRKIVVQSQRDMAGEQLRENIKSFLGVRFGALIALKSYYESLPKVTTKEFTIFAEGVTRQVPGFLAIEYIDQSGFITEIHPFDENKESHKVNIRNFRECVQPLVRSEREQGIAATTSMDIRQHGVGFMAFLPVNKGKTRNGWVAGAFEVATIVDESFIKVLRDKFYLRIFDQNGRIISMGPGEFPGEFTSRKVEIGDTTWEMRLAYKEGAVKGYAAGNRAVWAMGLFFVAALVLFATVIQLQNIRLEKTNVALAAANSKIREMESQKQEAIVANMVDGIIVADTGNRIVLINPAARKIFGLEDARPAGMQIAPLFEKFSLTLPIEEVMAAAGPQVFEMMSKGAEGVVFSTLHTRLKDSEGNDAGSVIAIRNITEMRLVENMKSEFIMMTSHKLKSPLAVVKSTISLFRDGIMGEVPERQLTALKKSYAQVEYLEGLIGKLLDFAAIEKKSLKISLEKERFSFDQVIGEILADLGAQIREKEITVEQALMPGIGMIIADRARVRQLFFNLIENAVKFNPKGTAVAVSDALEGGKLKVEVVDNGTGIPAHELPHIFDAFKQVDKYKTGQVRGIGLGLMIAKQIALAHDGDILAFSEEGKGTRFIVTLSAL
jgi:PAS domain S-box-containing protein